MERTAGASFLTGFESVFGLRFGKKIPELDHLIQSVEMNMENNYKDNAQSAFHELQDAYCSLTLSDKQIAHYEPILSDLAKRLEGFTHKEQKAFWYVKES